MRRESARVDNAGSGEVSGGGNKTSVKTWEGEVYSCKIALSERGDRENLKQRQSQGFWEKVERGVGLNAWHGGRPERNTTTECKDKGTSRGKNSWFSWSIEYRAIRGKQVPEGG